MPSARTCSSNLSEGDGVLQPKGFAVEARALLYLLLTLLKSVGLLASDLIFKLSSHVEMAKIPFIKTLRGQSHHYCTPRVENSIGNKVLM